LEEKRRKRKEKENGKEMYKLHEEKRGKRLKYRSKYRCINGGRKIKMLEFCDVGGRVGFSTLLTV
jgi:hypothetical protein